MQPSHSNDHDILVPYKHKTILFEMAIQFMKIVFYRAPFTEGSPQ
jgi:hypothetical protein